MGKYFSAFARHAKAREFLELKQGMMTVLEYVAKVRKFKDGLKLSIRGKIMGLLLKDLAQ